MSSQQSQWILSPTIQPPEWFIQAVKHHAPDLAGNYAAQLLWKRGIHDAEQLAVFLNYRLYKPASAFEFGQEMQQAVARLQQARDKIELVAIWGDFDADGITSTAVLWDGLGQFFPQDLQLFYHIPNRLTDSHGLNNHGIEALANRGIKLIVTCDTGSTNIKEIEYAQQLGIDIIVTDHHTLPTERPPVAAIINPRYLSPENPLFNLSGVAVAYKLVEALYQSLPDVPQQPLEDLLDLVAIGLIADLVQLSGDCRYLAQLGIEKLQKDLQKPAELRRRPGVGRLLELCRKSGDRPTDISFGIGPRINAVSRIQGDASFCVELLTSRDINRVEKLAQTTELANTRRKSLQKDVEQQVDKKLAQLDLSTTGIIVLYETGWPVGVLGLVAGQVAQKTGLPAILLSVEETEINHVGAGFTDNLSQKQTTELNLPLSEDYSMGTNQNLKLARGSARSVNQIDLYQLVLAGANLLHRFGGHPFAAGLSLPVENIPLFTEAINQKLRQQMGADGGLLGKQIIKADLIVKVADLGKDLFWELKLLEPCGMGNPVPQLLIKNCWFEKVWHRNIQDASKKKVQYIKTEFQLWDESVKGGFSGTWWGHYKDEIPQGRCDAIVEIDFNSYEKRYEVRLIAVRSCEDYDLVNAGVNQLDWILDWRDEAEEELQIADCIQIENKIKSEIPLIVRDCPSSWDELQGWMRRAYLNQQKLAIAYPPPQSIPPTQIWSQLVGIAKYLNRIDKTATLEQIQQKLGIGNDTLLVGLRTLSKLGFQITNANGGIRIGGYSEIEDSGEDAILQFLAAIREEQFRRQFFSSVPVTTIQSAFQSLI